MTDVVVCRACGSSLYHCRVIGKKFAGELCRASDMVPVEPGIPSPVEGEQLLCPKCKLSFAVPTSDRGLVLKLEDGSYWPHPPLRDFAKRGPQIA